MLDTLVIDMNWYLWSFDEDHEDHDLKVKSKSFFIAPFVWPFRSGEYLSEVIREGTFHQQLNRHFVSKTLYIL